MLNLVNYIFKHPSKLVKVDGNKPNITYIKAVISLLNSIKVEINFEAQEA